MFPVDGRKGHTKATDGGGTSTPPGMSHTSRKQRSSLAGSTSARCTPSVENSGCDGIHGNKGKLGSGSGSGSGGALR